MKRYTEENEYEYIFLHWNEASSFAFKDLLDNKGVGNLNVYEQVGCILCFVYLYSCHLADASTLHICFVKSISLLILTLHYEIYLRNQGSFHCENFKIEYLKMNIKKRWSTGGFGYFKNISWK